MVGGRICSRSCTPRALWLNGAQANTAGPRLRRVAPWRDVSLTMLARQAGLSVFHLQRAFSSDCSRRDAEQFTLRLRLGRAAAMLHAQRSALGIALECGLQSHEVFCRAFRRRFGYRPASIANVALSMPPTESIARGPRSRHQRVSPCIGPITPMNTKGAVPYIITRREISPTPVLIMRHRVKRSEIAPTIAKTLHAIFLYSQKNGIALAVPHPRGTPSRASDSRPSNRERESRQENAGHISEPGVIHDNLPGGPVALTTHHGSYDNLPEAHAALEAWIETEGTPTSARNLRHPSRHYPDRRTGKPNCSGQSDQACAENPIRRFEDSGAGSSSRWI